MSISINTQGWRATPYTQHEYAALHVLLIESADEDATELLTQIQDLGIE